MWLSVQPVGGTSSYSLSREFAWHRPIVASVILVTLLVIYVPSLLFLVALYVDDRLGLGILVDPVVDSGLNRAIMSIPRQGRNHD